MDGLAFLERAAHNPGIGDPIRQGVAAHKPKPVFHRLPKPYVLRIVGA